MLNHNECKLKRKNSYTKHQINTMEPQWLKKKKKINKLKILITEHSPGLICLSYTKNSINGLRASGSVAIYVKIFFPSKQINLKTHFEAITISVQLNETNLNVCNLYLRNQTKIKLSDIKNITKQLSKPFIILGDFNVHCTIWDRKKNRL